MEHFPANPVLYEEKSEILKALAHPIRLCIVRGLLSCDGSNVSKIQDCLEIPQSTLSQHLAKLKSAGIIAGERNGLEITYRVVHPKVKDIIEAIFKD